MGASANLTAIDNKCRLLDLFLQPNDSSKKGVEFFSI